MPFGTAESGTAKRGEKQVLPALQGLLARAQQLQATLESRRTAGCQTAPPAAHLASSAAPITTPTAAPAANRSPRIEGAESPQAVPGHGEPLGAADSLDSQSRASQESRRRHVEVSAPAEAAPSIAASAAAPLPPEPASAPARLPDHLGFGGQSRPSMLQQLLGPQASASAAPWRSAGSLPGLDSRHAECMFSTPETKAGEILQRGTCTSAPSNASRSGSDAGTSAGEPSSAGGGSCRGVGVRRTGGGGRCAVPRGAAEAAAVAAAVAEAQSFTQDVVIREAVAALTRPGAPFVRSSTPPPPPGDLQPQRQPAPGPPQQPRPPAQQAQQPQGQRPDESHGAAPLPQHWASAVHPSHLAEAPLSATRCRPKPGPQSMQAGLRVLIHTVTLSQDGCAFSSGSGGTISCCVRTAGPGGIAAITCQEAGSGAAGGFGAAYSGGDGGCGGLGGDRCYVGGACLLQTGGIAGAAALTHPSAVIEVWRSPAADDHRHLSPQHQGPGQSEPARCSAPSRQPGSRLPEPTPSRRRSLQRGGAGEAAGTLVGIAAVPLRRGAAGQLLADGAFPLRDVLRARTVGSLRVMVSGCGPAPGGPPPSGPAASSAQTCGDAARLPLPASLTPAGGMSSLYAGSEGHPLQWRQQQQPPAGRVAATGGGTPVKVPPARQGRQQPGSARALPAALHAGPLPAAGAPTGALPAAELRPTQQAGPGAEVTVHTASGLPPGAPAPSP